MKRINRLFHIFGLVALILSACQPIQPPVMQSAPAVPAAEQSMPAVPAEPHGLRADAPPYAVHGPYAVGVRNFNIDATKETERPLTVTVWYPALNPQGVKESITYEMGFPAGETPNVSIFGHAIENAVPAVDGAPYPLIVHTHGHWTFRQETAYLDEHLASMGFVVISADHEDNWSTLFGPKAWQSEFRRPNEVTREIDYAEKLGADGGPLAGIVDTGRVGVFGYSYGGETALVAAGARLDLGKLRAWCEENTVDGNVPDTDCVDILDHEAELAALAGLNETPQGLWPDWSDDRVDAVIGLAPWVGSLSEASLQTLNVPTLLMIGSSDTAAGPTYRPFQPYQKIAAERKAEVVFENAEHLFFFSACKDVPEVVDLGFDVFCTDPVWDMQRGHDLTAHFATAFLLAELKDDTDAAAALASENVAFTGVQYQETGYSEALEIGSAAEPQPPQGLRFDAPEYAIDGPYAVGVRYVNIPAATENDRDLIATVWYPAQKSDGAPAEMVYEQQFAPGEIPAFTVLGHAQLDALPDDSGAPYPLVVYSHAHWSFGQETPYFAEHLASRGFVVISTDHEDNWSTAFGPIAPQAYFRRPQEITRQIDYAEHLSADGGLLPGFISTNQVGVAGWSQGAMTALAAAGTRLNLANAAAWCQENPDTAELNTTACPDLVGREAELAAFAGLDETPAELWPDWSDERVGAVVAMAPSTIPFGTEGMQSVNVPVMFLIGSGETSVDGGFEMASPYERVVSESKAKVVFDYGEHLMFFSSCADSPSIVALGFPMFCTDPVWDTDRAHDLINHFATSFLLAELKGDAEAATALAAENVSFPGIQYETTGYGAAGEAAPQPGLDDATVAKIEALVEETMTNGQVPGAAVGVVKDGKLVYSKGFGVTALGSDEPVTPESIFSMASVSKSVVGMAIMQLVEDGKIELDAPVTKYLPYFALADPEAKEITIRQLLTHQSGLREIGDWIPEWSDEKVQTDEGALDAYVRSLVDEKLIFPPGKGWSYSSIAFDILGDVIAKASGQSFETYAQERILTPLGMTHSSFLLSDVDPADLTNPHMVDAEGKVETVDFFPYSRNHAPGVSLFSSVNDMARLVIANMNRGELDGVRVLPASAYADMWAAQAASPWAQMFGPQMTSYGLGWWVGEFNGHSTIGNYGAVTGFQSHLGIFPKEGIAVIALVNLFDPETGAFRALEIGNGMAEVLLGTEPTEAAAEGTALDPAMVAEIDTLVTETMARINLPGFALAVVKDGNLAYAKGFGVTSLDGGEPVTPQTVFQWAESSMALTAMAVMQLVEEGKLALDAPVIDYVPYFKLADERYKEITVGQLLAHTSGIPDSGDAMADWENFMPEYDGGALERWIRGDLAQKGLLFAPGTGWEYSDIAYALLGAVIGAASGQPYEEYMQEHIFAPLGMDKSTFLLEEVDKTLLASPHVPDAAGEVVVSAAMPYHRPFAATNNLFGNVEDMAKLAQANLNRGVLADQRILPESAYDAMWTATSPTPFADFPFGRVHPSAMMADWGNGWFLGDVAGHLTPNSYGGEYGFNADMVLVPDANLAVVAIGNSQAMDEFYAPDIATDVMGMLLEGIEPQETTADSAATAMPADTQLNAAEVFVKGAPVRFPVGLAIGPDGNLYVGGRVSPWLSVVNPDTGEIVKRYGAQDGVDVPSDLAFGPDGSLYWTRYPGLLGDGVQRMSPDGTITGTTLPPYPWPVFVTKEGRLFVSQGLAPNTLWELDPNFQVPARQLMSDNSIFIHFAEGPDGKLYALKWFAGEIIRFDPDTPEQVETVATGLTLPFNLAFDSKGQLYLIIGVDSSTDAVARLDLTSGKTTILATMHNLLYGLAIDSKDRIFVSSASDGTIFEVLSEGGVRVVTPGGMILPGGLEVVARPDGESLFLADWIAWREYDVATGALRSQTHSTWWSGGLVYPDTIAHFGDNLVIVSSETGQILIWDAQQQKQVLLLNEPGVDNAIVFADQLVAANYTTKEVTQFDPAAPEQRVVLASDMEYPLGLAANRENLYVGDYVTGQILQIVADGAKIEPPKLIAQGLQGPDGLALTGDGRLLVVESGSDRLSAIDLSSGTVSQIASDLGVIQQGSPTIRQHYLFNGVAVSPSGMIYVTADEPNVIYRLPLLSK